VADVLVVGGGSAGCFQTMATMRSQLAPADGPPDLHLFAAGRFDTSQDASPAGAVFGLVTGLVLPYSRAGYASGRPTPPTRHASTWPISATLTT
jgi:hypothetical protein